MSQWSKEKISALISTKIYENIKLSGAIFELADEKSYVQKLSDEITEFIAQNFVENEPIR